MLAFFQEVPFLILLSFFQIVQFLEVINLHTFFGFLSDIGFEGFHPFGLVPWGDLFVPDTPFLFFNILLPAGILLTDEVLLFGPVSFLHRIKCFFLLRSQCGDELLALALLPIGGILEFLAHRRLSSMGLNQS